jgi:hypothetical protein
MKKNNIFTTVILLFFISISFSQKHTLLLKKLEAFDHNEKYNSVEKEILEASKYILFQPFSVKDKDKNDAIKAVDRWLVYTDSHTFPIIGKLYNSIKDNEYLVLLYKTSMVNYILDQKLNYDRTITCNINPPKGKTYLEQNDVQELHYESAKLFINYLKENNELNQGKKFSKIVASNEQNNLRKVLFDNLP